MRVVSRLCVVLLFAAVIGCKKTTTSTSVTVTSSSASGPADHATASGAGAVNVIGNVVTYQNVHIELPWRMDDVATIVRLAGEASAGKGLKLSDGKTTLEISSDGRRLTLNGKPCGNVQEGDRVKLTPDGKLSVNDAERLPQAPTTAGAGG